MNIKTNISLKTSNTFGIDVSAAYFLAFSHADELMEFFSSGTSVVSPAVSPLVLGGGSNILFTRNVAGIVLKNEIKGIQKIKEDADHIYIKAGSGENWHQFVLYCLENDYAGVENLSLIPGSVGASPLQNIGAYGVEIKDVFFSLEAFDLSEKKIISFDKADCAFGYRESVFKNKLKGKFIITSVTYKLNKTPVLNISYGAVKQELEQMKINEISIRDVSKAVINIRQSKLPDPKITGNAGSFFKNPEVSKEVFKTLQTAFPGIVAHTTANENMKLAAGWMIEQCGWKGYRKGDAGCHPKQALVLVNYGKAKGSEILDLSAQIMQSVQDKFGVLLEREVNIF